MIPTTQYLPWYNANITRQAYATSGDLAYLNEFSLELDGRGRKMSIRVQSMIE